MAVEASPGHDIGIISLKGPLVPCQLRKHNINPQSEFKTIYRKVKPVDIEKWKNLPDDYKRFMLSKMAVAPLKTNSAMMFDNYINTIENSKKGS